MAMLISRAEYFDMDMERAKIEIRKHSASTKTQIETQLNSIFNRLLIELQKRGIVETGCFNTDDVEEDEEDEMNPEDEEQARRLQKLECKIWHRERRMRRRCSAWRFSCIARSTAAQRGMVKNQMTHFMDK